MANSCKKWCGVSLFGSLVVGLIALLVVYLIVVKLIKKDDKGDDSMAAENGDVGDLEMTEKQMKDAAKKASSSKPLIVMVYAPWCGHCKAMKPDFVESARELGQIAHFGCLNGDNAKSFCTGNDIAGFPCMLRFENGKIVDKAPGRRDKSTIKSFVVKK